MGVCLFCHIRGDDIKRYCSNQCQSDNLYWRYILLWKTGAVSGNRGINARALSMYVVRYIKHKYKQRCARCHWSEVNPITYSSPLEIDHIDGNAENSREENLILLCPNCHALTPSYKKLNNGRGRVWRREKYVRINKLPL